MGAGRAAVPGCGREGAAAEEMLALGNRQSAQELLRVAADQAEAKFGVRTRGKAAVTAHRLGLFD